MVKITIIIPDGYTRLDGIAEIYDPVHAMKPEQKPYLYAILDRPLVPNSEVCITFPDLKDVDSSCPFPRPSDSTYVYPRCDVPSFDAEHALKPSDK